MTFPQETHQNNISKRSLCDQVIEPSGMKAHLHDVHDDVITLESYYQKYGGNSESTYSTVGAENVKDENVRRTSKRLAETRYSTSAGLVFSGVDCESLTVL